MKKKDIWELYNEQHANDTSTLNVSTPTYEVSTPTEVVETVNETSSTPEPIQEKPKDETPISTPVEDLGSESLAN